MLDENNGKLVGACGINCAACGIYLAHTRKDVEWQKRISKDIFGPDAEIAPERIACNGCGGERGAHWSPECEIMLCAHEKDLIACSQCKEFQCPKLETFYSKGYGKAKDNALRQQEIGLEAWWREQQQED